MFKTLVIFSALLFVTSGCGQPVSFKPEATALETLPGYPDSPPAPIVDTWQDGVSDCEINISQLAISGAVNSFEFKNSFGISFGYNPGGSHNNVGGSIGVKISTAQMELSMFGADPLTGMLLAGTDVTSKQTKTNIGAEINFDQIKVNPDYYFETPLAKVSEKGLESAIKNLKDHYDKESPWVGRVLQVLNQQELMILNGGADHGIQEGDQFDIVQVQHFWQGTPCASKYFGSMHSPEIPVATVKIVSVGPHVSYAAIVSKSTNRIKRGSEVLVKQLVAPAKGKPARYLKKNISLGKLTAKDIVLPGGAPFKLEDVINKQILNVLLKSGFVINN